MSGVTERDQAEAQGLAAALQGMPGLVALTLGGSAVFGMADAASDLDLHVYWRAPLAPDAERAARLEPRADPGSVTVGIDTWGLEDHLRLGGRLVELVYVNLDDLLALAERAYGPGLTDEGFATAPLAYVAAGQVLLDQTGELGALRERLLAGYPEATRRALFGDNPARLRAYLKQLRTAQTRGDLLYVQHRRYSVQMVFFNLLFALNRVYNPGEKRLHRHGERCPQRPRNQTERWIQIARLPADDPTLPEHLETLVDDLRELVETER